MKIPASLASPAMPIRHSPGQSCPLGQVTGSGELTRDETMTQPPWDRWRKFGQYALVYLTQGSGRYLDTHGRDTTLHAGDLILVFPNLGHRYGPSHPKEHWREVYLAFQGPIFEQWHRTNLLNEHQTICHLKPIATWRRRIAQVIDHPPPTTAQAATVEVCRLQQLLADILAVSQTNHHQPQTDWLADARKLLDQGLTPQEAAAKIQCAHATFRKKFTQLAGVTPTRYQATRTIDQACELMHLATLNDRAIALKLGYCDEFHFSRRFKQITGMSPRTYRQQLP